MSGFQIAVRALLAGILIVGSLATSSVAQNTPGAKVSGGFVSAHLQSERGATPHRGPLQPSEVPSLEGSAVEYLIITRDDLAAEFERLAQWKTQKGVPAVVRTLDDVQADTRAGSDLAETIRNYIRDAYLYWGVQFVLLGGDTDVIPARYVEFSLLDLERPLSELYYACLDGSWNADGDAFFGEPAPNELDPGDAVDLAAEVYLGRAPVSTPREAGIFVDKTLRHERPTDTSFQNDMLLLAEVLFPADWQPDGPPPSADGAMFAEEIAAVPADMRITRLYEAHASWPGASPLGVTATRDALEAGYGSVVHIGHGYRYTLSLGDGSLDVPDASQLTNGARAGLFYMLNCTATAFDFDSMAEALLLNPDGGATLVVGAAREAFPLAARGYQRAFFEEVFVLDERRVGAAMSRSRERLASGPQISAVDLWTQLVYTLLGDPEAPLWSEARSDLTVDGVPADLVVGNQQLVLQVSNGDGPLANARVCVHKADDEYRVVRTNASGEAVVDVQPGTVGMATLTVTAADHVPVEWTLPVQAAGVALGVDAPGLNDDGGGAGFGNGDGVLDAGETVSLSLPLRNVGSSAAMNVRATLVTEGPSVEVLQATSNYPDVPAGEVALAATPFEVRIDAVVADGTIVDLRLDVQHAGGSETRRVDLMVSAARPELLSLRIDDSRAGNGDGIQDPGEEIDLYYRVINRGNGAATGVRIELTQPSPGLELPGAFSDVVEVPAGEVREGTTALVIREADVVQSRSARLTLLHRQDVVGTARTFEPRRPVAPQGLRFGIADAPDAVRLEWEPNPDADLLGYNVYRSRSTDGPFERVNSDIVLQSYYRDTGLLASTRYFYRVVAVDAALFEGSTSAVTSASTNPPQLAGWPLRVDDFSAASPVIGDVHGQGRNTVVSAARNVFAWDADGVELRDADNNALTWGLFFGDREVYGTPTLADMDPRPGREIVVPTWDAGRRFVMVLDAQGQPLPHWPQHLVPANEALRGAHVAPVVANIDGTGAPEVLLAARDGRLYAWHADGTEVADGDKNASTHGVLLDTGSPFLRCAPGVADLDPDHPGLEIAIGSTDGTLHLVGANGRPRPGWPRTTGGDGAAFGALFASGIAIADLNLDGRLEMVFTESSGRLHAMQADGSELDGYPIEGLRSTGPSIVPSVAIGDLVGDEALEVVAATSSGNIEIFDALGNPLLNRAIVSGAGSESSPILGDVDGDGEIEIVFGNEDGILNAWNLDTSPVDGFPIAIGSEIRATPVLADVHGNGRTSLVVQAWSGVVSVFDLDVSWDAARFPWPTYRGNIHRTGEFAFEVPTPVALSNASVRSNADGAVLLAWSAADAGTEVEWRIQRAGPFVSEPGIDPALRRDLVEVGRVRGAGPLQFRDEPPLRGRWYVYALSQHEPQGGARLERFFAVRALAPAVLSLHPAFPNPFNPGTRLGFDVPDGVRSSDASATPVRIDVYDVHGRHVRTLLDDKRLPGTYRVDWDGRDAHGQRVASGVYLVQMRAAQALRSQKVVRLR